MPGDQDNLDRPSGTVSFDQMYTLYATDVLRVSYYYLGNKEYRRFRIFNAVYSK